MKANQTCECGEMFGGNCVLRGHKPESNKGEGAADDSSLAAAVDSTLQTAAPTSFREAPPGDYFDCDSCGVRVDPYSDDGFRGDLCASCAEEEDLTASEIAGIKGDQQRASQKDGDS